MKETKCSIGSDLVEFISTHRKSMNLTANDVEDIQKNASLMNILKEKTEEFMTDFCLDSLPCGHYDISADILCDILSDELVAAA